MKSLLLSLLLLAAGGAVHAQFGYTLTAQTGQPYTPLAGAQDVNDTLIWDEEQWVLPMPFTFHFGADTVSSFNLSLPVSGVFNDVAFNNLNLLSGFNFLSADLADRGLSDGLGSRSPIRYAITGTAPGRIFKLEIANAGFYNEYNTHGTMDDSVNIQVWLYEGSDVVELRYGSSYTSYLSENGFFSTQPAIGYIKNLDWQNGTIERYYALSGDPAHPGIDSFNIATLAGATLLDSYPADGTVYRFTPKQAAGLYLAGPRGVLLLKVYPTAASGRLQVHCAEAGSYRIVSMQGRVAMEGRLRAGDNTLDVQALAKGSYLLRVQAEAGYDVVRFQRL